MHKDPIVEEIRLYRNEYSKELNHDLKKMAKDLQEKEKLSNRKILNPGPRKRLTKTGS